MRTLLALLLTTALAATARADCLDSVPTGAVDARTGLHYINYQRCHWEAEHNANIDVFVAARNYTEITLSQVTDTNWDGFVFFIAGQALTLLDVGCYCQGDTGTPPTFTFADVDGNGIGTSALSCVNGTTRLAYATFNAGDTDRELEEGEGVAVTVTNSPTLQDCTLVLRW